MHDINAKIEAQRILYAFTRDLQIYSGLYIICKFSPSTVWAIKDDNLTISMQLNKPFEKYQSATYEQKC